MKKLCRLAAQQCNVLNTTNCILQNAYDDKSYFMCIFP